MTPVVPSWWSWQKIFCSAAGLTSVPTALPGGLERLWHCMKCSRICHNMCPMYLNYMFEYLSWLANCFTAIGFFWWHPRVETYCHCLDLAADHRLFLCSWPHFSGISAAWQPWRLMASLGRAVGVWCPSSLPLRSTSCCASLASAQSSRAPLAPSSSKWTQTASCLSYTMKDLHDLSACTQLQACLCVLWRHLNPCALALLLSLWDWARTHYQQHHVHYLLVSICNLPWFLIDVNFAWVFGTQDPTSSLSVSL